MAEVKKSVVGVISGRLDNIVFVVRNGKSYASVRPRKYKAGKSAAAKTGRNNFAISVKLARSVNSTHALKEIWAAAPVKGTDPYHRIIIFNAKRVKEGSLTTSNKITPDGMLLKINSASIQNNILHLSFFCPSGTSLKFPAELFVFLYFAKAGKSVVRLSYTIEESSPDGLYNLDTELDNQLKRMELKDPNPIIYLALAGGTSYKNKVYWTSTGSIQLD